MIIHVSGNQITKCIWNITASVTENAFKEQGTAIFRDPNTIEFSIVETLDGKENGTLKAIFKKKT